MQSGKVRTRIVIMARALLDPELFWIDQGVMGWSEARRIRRWSRRVPREIRRSLADRTLPYRRRRMPWMSWTPVSRGRTGPDSLPGGRLGSVTFGDLEMGAGC